MAVVFQSGAHFASLPIVSHKTNGRKKKFNYSSNGVKHLLDVLENDKNIIFDCTSAAASGKIYPQLKNKLKRNFYVNLTPAPIGKYFIPYF